MTDSITSLFDTGLQRYNAGEGPDTLIPVFKDICDRSPNGCRLELFGVALFVGQ
jgi:hypothetical protein